jgi:uncharacterized protein YqeY
MRKLTCLALGLLFLSGSGCFTSSRDHGDPYQQAVKKELAELVKSYRVCLQKYEDNPSKAKESCGVYRDAIHDLAQTNDRRTIGEILDRIFLSEKGRG